MESIEKQTLLDPIFLQDYFWNMFVIDAIIGNWDRHNGNWGFLYNQESDEIKIAPIFDCGSCLFPQIDENLIKEAFNNKQCLNVRVYDFPTSAISKNGKRINYYNFIKSHEYKECDKAVERIKNLLDLNKINELIDTVECITDNHRLFLKTIIKLRIEKFLYE